MLSDEDRAAVERLVLDRGLDPSFDVLKSCLVWTDEIPRGISEKGHEYVQELWIVRGWIHRGVPVDKWPFDPESHLRVWDDAMASGLRWPGFHRLALSSRDQEFLRERLADEDGLEKFLLGWG